jgi:TorA maturation chaperone TorD
MYIINHFSVLAERLFRESLNSWSIIPIIGRLPRGEKADMYNDEYNERARLYKLFSTLVMKEPSEETLLQIREIFRMKFDETPNEIREDFASIFLRPDLHLSPHESLHNYPLGETPRLWGLATEEVQAFYRSTGLMLDEEADLIPDHLGVELLFMSYLIENDLTDHQKEFMEEHLLPWIPEYCDEVRKHAGTTFYRELAILLKEFVVSDNEQLSGGP